jgi:hypothetical protein
MQTCATQIEGVYSQNKFGFAFQEISRIALPPNHFLYLVLGLTFQDSKVNVNPSILSRKKSLPKKPDQVIFNKLPFLSTSAVCGFP